MFWQKANSNGNSSRSFEKMSFNNSNLFCSDESTINVNDNSPSDFNMFQCDSVGQKECDFCKDWSLPDPKQLSTLIKLADKNILSCSSAYCNSNMAHFDDDFTMTFGPVLDYRQKMMRYVEWNFVCFCINWVYVYLNIRSYTKKSKWILSLSDWNWITFQ